MLLNVISSFHLPKSIEWKLNVSIFVGLLIEQEKQKIVHWCLSAVSLIRQSIVVLRWKTSFFTMYDGIMMMLLGMKESASVGAGAEGKFFLQLEDLILSRRCTGAGDPMGAIQPSRPHRLYLSVSHYWRLWLGAALLNKVQSRTRYLNDRSTVVIHCTRTPVKRV